MGYVRTAGMSTAARRRRRRTALVLTLLLLILGVILFFAIVQFREASLPGAGDNGDQTAAPTEQAPDDGEDGPDPSEITVNVYNAAGRPGLAGTTADALATYGYDIAGFDNDPLGATVETVDIRHGANGLDAATQLQQSLFPDAQLVADEREDGTVDLVLGDGFDTLDPAGTGGD